MNYKFAMRKVLVGTLFIFICFLMSCKPGVPNRYLQPHEMENILYDYHIAEGMSNSFGNDGDKGITRRTYQLTILKKYGVTEAEFDSSMVYYMRHTEQLHSIYENIVKRMNNEATSLGASANSIGEGTFSANGDTANIWTGNRSMVLTPNPPFNQSSYSFKTDSTFHKGDMLTLSFSTQFIYQDGIRDGIAVFSVRLGNDSVVYRRINVSASSRYNLQINDDKHLGIKELRGFFMLNNSFNADQSSSTLQILFVQNIRIVRIRENKNMRQTVVKQDSLRRDTMPRQPLQQPRLNPVGGQVNAHPVPNIPRPVKGFALPPRNR